MFTPLLFLDFDTAYRLVTLLTLLCYATASLLIPAELSKGRLSSLLVFLFTVGLFGYGLQFELERGQFNVIALFLGLLSVYVYHHHPRYRYAAYLLLTLAIQLKVYPAIFAVTLVRDWRDWKGNLARLVTLSALNLAALFVLGPGVFFDFLAAIAGQALQPAIWIGNHSIRSFVAFVGTAADAQVAQVVLYGIVGVCLCLILVQAYVRRTSGLNPHLLIACTISALVIPPVSHDYTLSILTPPVAVFLLGCGLDVQVRRRRIASAILVLTFSAAYSSTLFSFTNKPVLLGNNLPALTVMLITATLLALLAPPVPNFPKSPDHAQILALGARPISNAEVGSSS